ncbi:S41 family peptidase [Candidatus Shapirobacteria bacterium]|nr:S41 family peptidase [Candidatus Shapirobacteria bacterium]
MKKTKISFSSFKSAVLITFLVILGGGVGFRLGVSKTLSLPNSVSSKADLSLFWHVWQRLEERYLDQKAIDEEKMVYGAIRGMVEALGDPYTAFFPPQENKVAKEELNGEFGGVGIQLGYKNETLSVIAPLDGTPADRAGVKAGDLILKIVDKNNEVDQDTEGISLPEAVKLIRGKEGTIVTLTLMRENQFPFEIDLVRDKIVIPSLTEDWLEKDGKRIAYVHLLQFSEVMYEQWEDWVRRILQESQSSDFGGVILDLRNNPGGYLEGSVYIASEFLSSGVVVKQEGVEAVQAYQVSRVGQLLEVPLVVLVNRGSASASEILAGALKHYNRAKIVGEKTFGKGTVQEPEDFPGGSGLHTTVARWLLPGGENIHNQGIEPDITVTLEEEISDEVDQVLERGMETLLE